ncbi:MAG: hypothetical protein QNL60_09505 [Flavobacteriales bacterium]
MKKMVFLSLFIISSFSYSQTYAEMLKSEIGIDGYFSIGNQGGNFSAGLKWGLLQKKEDSKIIIGPSVRWIRVWTKNLAFGNQATSYNIVGVGGFIHARVFEALYAGIEIEGLKSPISYTNITPQKTWIPTVFIGGGYSKSFDENFRLNIGIFYDIVNNLNSPYRPSYVAKKTGPNGEPGALIPVLYRVQLFIPLGANGGN